MNTDGVAAEIADALAARVVEVPSVGESPTFAILCADGALAVVVHGHRGSCRIARVDGGTRVVRFTQGWDPDVWAWVVAKGRPQQGTMSPHMVEFCLAGLSVLREAFSEEWLMSMAGNAEHPEAWLLPPERESSAVRVSPRGFAVWVGEGFTPINVQAHAMLLQAAEQVVPLVREQRRLYAANVVLSAEVERISDALLLSLNDRFHAPDGRPWTVAFVRGDKASHQQIVARAIVWTPVDEMRRTVATIKADEADEERAVRVEISGPDGWRGAWTESAMDDIAAAIGRNSSALHVRDMKPGERFIVLDAIQELATHEVVVFRGLDQIANHYREYHFESETGIRLTVRGDNPLRDAHRYLKRAS